MRFFASESDADELDCDEFELERDADDELIDTDRSRFERFFSFLESFVDDAFGADVESCFTGGLEWTGDGVRDLRFFFDVDRSLSERVLFSFDFRGFAPLRSFDSIGISSGSGLDASEPVCSDFCTSRCGLLPAGEDEDGERSRRLSVFRVGCNGLRLCDGDFDGERWRAVGGLALSLRVSYRR